MTLINRRLVNGAWLYPEQDLAAALQLAQWGLSLERLDDVIEAMAAAPTEIAPADLAILLRDRTHALQVLAEQGPMAVRYIADALAGRLQRAEQQPLVKAALKQSKAQSKRRKDLPATTDGSRGRNEHIRKYHARLKAAGRNDATSATATEFGLHTRTIRRILAG